MILHRAVIGMSEGWFSNGSCIIIAVSSTAIKTSGIMMASTISITGKTLSRPKGRMEANT